MRSTSRDIVFGVTVICSSPPRYYIDLCERRVHGVTTLQRWIRRWNRNRIHSSALRIQKAYRKRRAQWLILWLKLRLFAASRIAAAWRGYLTRQRCTLPMKRLQRQWEIEVCGDDAVPADSTASRTDELRSHITELRAQLDRSLAWHSADDRRTLSLEVGPREPMSLPLEHKRRLPVYGEMKAYQRNPDPSGMHAWLGEAIWPRKALEAPKLATNEFEPGKEVTLAEIVHESIEAAAAAADVEQVDEASLLPNIRTAISCKTRIQHVMESCKSDAEVKKINDAKKLEAELEAAAELERKQGELAARISSEKHYAASRMESICRGHSSRAHIKKLRRERATELENAENERDRVFAIKIQKAYRGYSVREGFRASGVSVTSITHRGDDRVKELVKMRVENDFNNRRLYERLAAIHLLGILRKRVERDYEDELVNSSARLAEHDAKREVLKAATDSCNNAVAMLKIELSQTPEQTPEHALLELDLKTEAARKAHFAYTLDICETQLWWATQNLRQHYRRHRSSVLLSSNTAEALQWLARESQQLHDLRRFVQDRLGVVKESIENRYFIEWLKDQKERIISQSIGFDMEQEFLIAKTNTRLDLELRTASKAAALVNELLLVFRMDSQFDSEKVGLDRQRLRKDPASDEHLRLLEYATELKRKQQYLREGIQLKIRVQLEGLFRDEDAFMDRTVSFKGDEQGLSRDRLPAISAVLKEDPKVRKHLEMDKWMDLYRSQPWLAKQAAEEARHKEKRDTKRAEIAKIQAILDKQREELDVSDAIIKGIEAEIAEHQAVLDDAESSAEDRYTARQDMSMKTESLDQKREDQVRREEVYTKREAELKVLTDELSAEESEAQERLAKQKTAKMEFENRESDAEASQVGDMKERMAQLEADQAEIAKQLAMLEVPPSAGSGRGEGEGGGVLTFVSPEHQELIEQLREQQQLLSEESAEISKKEREMQVRDVTPTSAARVSRLPQLCATVLFVQRVHSTKMFISSESLCSHWAQCLAGERRAAPKAREGRRTGSGRRRGGQKTEGVAASAA